MTNTSKSVKVALRQAMFKCLRVRTAGQKKGVTISDFLVKRGKKVHVLLISSIFHLKK